MEVNFLFLPFPSVSPWVVGGVMSSIFGDEGMTESIFPPWIAWGDGISSVVICLGQDSVFLSITSLSLEASWGGWRSCACDVELNFRSTTGGEVDRRSGHQSWGRCQWTTNWSLTERWAVWSCGLTACLRRWGRRTTIGGLGWVSDKWRPKQMRTMMTKMKTNGLSDDWWVTSDD